MDLPHRAEAGSSLTVMYPPPDEEGVQASDGVAEVPASDPAVWGPFCWTWLHMSAAHYPERDPGAERAAACRQHLASLPHMLPCPRCRRHCLRWMARHRKAVEAAPAGRRALESLLVALHNAVNREHRKPELELESARALYRSRLVFPAPPARSDDGSDSDSDDPPTM